MAHAAAATYFPAQATTARRTSLFAILVLAVLSLLCAPFFVDHIDHGAPRARDGMIDYSRWGPLNRPVELRGEWRLIWHTAPAPEATVSVKVPGQWTGPRTDGPPLPQAGSASYHLTLRGLAPGRYTLYVPRITAGSRVVVNGRVLSERGRVGVTPETTTYIIRAHEAPILADGSDLDVQVDLATFHYNASGLEAAPVFGLAQPMSRWITLDWLRSLLLVTSLLLLACYGAVVFLFRRRDRASLYSCLGCLFLLPLVGLMSHDNLILIGLPRLSFEGMITLQYMTTTIALSFVLAYAKELFPRENWRPAYLTLQGVNLLRLVVYGGVAMTGDMLLLSRLSQAAVSLRTVTFVYVLGVVALACWRRRDGAVVFLFGLGVFFTCLVYTDLVSNAGFPRLTTLNLLPIGILWLLFSQIVILAERWSLAINTAEQTNIDLRRLLDVNISITSEMQLEALLAKIVQVTSKVIHADRTSLFLHDERTGELWSVVAEGVRERQIRFPADRGLAGWVFSHGEAVNLADAYADPRFNREVDAQTGYRTQSVLAAPVTTREGRRVGVMQALNHQHGQAFDEADLQRLSAFAAQAAIAIENATLFSDVASERNYNESILRSMSTGVVTLDASARLAKLNEAAARILELPADTLAGADARAWIAANNPALLAEIDAVAVSGQPKSLLEAEVRTATGAAISANIQIVPLLSDGVSVGLLILVEDISEGKRVQGALRRFMSQQVVDQVMSHGDELMFGAGCRASILFADIRGFTSIAEALAPRATVDLLNEVFTDLVEAVSAADGVLDKFLGDAIMAVYGAPLPSGRDPANAVESAIAMIRTIEAVNARRVARGQARLGLGIGIATGDVVAGTIGSHKRMDYTVVGDPVNLASRLQQITKVYQAEIIVCEETAAALADQAPLRELDAIRIRGRARPIKIFEVLTEADAERSAALEPYRRGREALERRRWRDAVTAFETAVAADPADRPSAIMLERARILARQPPGADWDGVWDSAEAA
jgi:adenylate cyclase